jgi:anthranilate synthase/aminodeoxychorismate synthase-like glutamine amidotransferase
MSLVPTPEKRVLFVDNYDSFTWNLVHLFARVGVACEVVRNDVLSVSEAKARALAAGGLVISPGPGTPDGAGIVLDLLRELAFEVPVFGVCLGHQALGQHFGGRVVRAERRMHGRVSAIEHVGSGVFSGLPSPLSVTRYHSLVVEREGLAEEVEITASTPEGDVMGLRHRVLPAEGVQFHPESFLSERGAEMLSSFAARIAPRKSA